MIVRRPWGLIISALILCSVLYGADARSLHGGGGSASNWNGGLVQTSLSASSLGSGEYIPINRLQDSRDWGTVNSSGNTPVNITEENATGFPNNNTNLAAVGGWQTFFSFPSQAQRSGNYILDWTGTGSTTWDVGSASASIVSITGSGCTSTSTTVSGVNCTATLDETGKINATLKITAVASGGPTRARFYHVNDTTAIAAGQVCKGGSDSKFYQTVGANFGVIRDLNSSNANFSNVAVWADRTPLGWFSYGANNYFPQSLVTTNSWVNTSGAQYTLAFGGFALVDKAHVIVIPPALTAPSYTSAQTVSSGTTLQLTSTTGIVAGMTAGDSFSQNALQPTVTVASVNGGTNTVTFISNPFQGTVTTGDVIYFSPMLNVNGTGSIPVVLNSGTAFGTQNADNKLYAHWSTFTYDAGLNVWLSLSNPNINQGLTGGMPPEAFVACANETGAHPWFVIPPYAVDAPTDFVLQEATYTKNNLKSGLIPRFEPPNETWNHGFFVTTYADNREYLRSGANGDHPNWYGRAISQLGQTVSSVFGANRASYKVEACMSSISIPQAVAISAGSYNSGTGVVTLTTSTAITFLQPNQSIVIRGATGTGSVASVNGSFTTGTGTNGTTIKYTIATGLTLTIGSTGYAEFGLGSQGEKLTSPEYVSNGGSAAYNWVTDICPTSYYQSSYATTATEVGYAYWFTHGATGGQQDTIVGNYLAGAMTTGFAGNLYWLQNTLWPGFNTYLTTFTGIGLTMYEGAYGSTGGCGYTAESCGLVTNSTVVSVTTGSTTTLTVGATSSASTQSGSTLTVGGTVAGIFAVGQQLYGPGLAQFTIITGLGTGTGGVGTYTVFPNQTISSPVAISASPNPWDYICNTASKCTGGQPTTSLSGFAGGCGLNALDPAVLSATPTTVTVNVNSTGFVGCAAGTAAYDGAGTSAGYVKTFEIGVKQNTNAANLQATELSFLQSFYSAGGRFPAEYVDSDASDWGKYNPDVYQTATPVISAVQAFQLAP